MKEAAYKLNDWKLRLAGIPLVGVIIPVMLNFEDFLKLNTNFAINVLFSTSVTLALWEGNRYNHHPDVADFAGTQPNEPPVTLNRISRPTITPKK